MTPTERMTVHLPPETTEEARNAVVHLAGPPEHLTMTALVTAALQRELTRLKRKYNDGKPFPQRKGGRLKSGRRVE